MSILVVLVGGLTSAIVLSTRALPANSVERDSASRVGAAAAQIAEEMRAALWFIERTATQVTFTVPDRNADGVPERIRYAWSGAAGDDLRRDINSGGEAVFVPAVESFAVSFTIATETETFVGAPVESADSVLRSYRGSVSMADLPVSTTRWYGEYFMPTLPADALSWSVKRASVFAKSNSSNDGVTSIELLRADGSNLPTGSALGQQSLLESGLSGGSYSKRTFNYSGVSGLSPEAGLCLVARGTSGSSPTVDLEYQSAGVSFANAGFLSYSGSWSIRTDRALSFEIVGTYTQPGANQTMQRNFITGVGVSLTAGGQPASAAARTLNRPEALSACWNTDFTRDPTLDGNGDGYPDWEARGLPINLGAMVSHKWTGTQKLYTTPDCYVRRPTRAIVRFSAAAVAGSIAEFSMPFDWSGGTTAGIVARLTQQVDGTQTLTVSTKTSDTLLRTLVTVANLSSRTVELGLRLDPARQTVNIETDGRSRGTYNYDRYTPTTDEPRAAIAGSGGGGTFESVTIRVDE